MDMIANPVSYESFEAFVQFLLNYAIGTSVLVAVIALIVAGFKYILAMGDEDKIKSATKSLIFAIVGLVVVFIAPILIQFIMNQLNIGI
jgi:type IV secretory pathway VirB2 component (pilin)